MVTLTVDKKAKGNNPTINHIKSHQSYVKKYQERIVYYSKTTKSGNSLEKYFRSPESSKKRKMSNLDLSGNSDSPPTKRLDKDKESKDETVLSPSSDKVCKHLDTQLSDMEKRLESSLSASLSASITASVTAGLKDLIDTSLKTALVTMSNKVNEVIEEHPVIVQHGEQLDSLETENLILKSKMSKMEDESSQMKKKIATMKVEPYQTT